MARHNSPNFWAKMSDRYFARRKAERHTKAGPVLELRLDGRWRVLAAYSHEELGQINARQRGIEPAVLAEGAGEVPNEWRYLTIDGGRS